MNDVVLKFELTVEQTNFILNILGKYPFDEVVNLIKVIKEQGEPQVVAAMQAQADAAQEVTAE